MIDRWETILAIDHDRWAAACYRANFPGVRVECGNVADYLDSLPAADVVLGGPPCQPFSQAGERKGDKDARDGVPDFLAAVKRTRPRMFLMENVEGFMTIEGGRYCRRVFADMGELGYVPDVMVLDAVHFGVPQFRSRCWWWGIRSDLYAAGVRHKWPRPTHQWPWPEAGGLFGDGYALLPAVTVGQALGITRASLEPHGYYPGGELDCAAPAPTMRGGRLTGCSDILIHEYRWSDAMLEKHPPASPDEPCPTVQAKWFKGGAEGLLRVYGGGRNHPADADGNYRRDKRDITDEPSTTVVDYNGATTPTLRSGTRMVRRLTPAECMRLQSAPDDYRWPKGITKTAMYRVAGNGWASGMAAHMSRALADADPESRTCIDLFSGGGLGACGWHGRYWPLSSDPTPEPTP